MTRIITADTPMDEILAAPLARQTAVLHAAEAARIVRSVYPTASIIEFAHAEYDRFATGVLFLVWTSEDDDEPLFNYNIHKDGGKFTDDQLDLIESLLTWAADNDVSELFTEAAEPDGVAWALDLDEVLRLDRLIAIGRTLHYAIGTAGIAEDLIGTALSDLALEQGATDAFVAELAEQGRWAQLGHLLDLLGEPTLTCLLDGSPHAGVPRQRRTDV